MKKSSFFVPIFIGLALLLISFSFSDNRPMVFRDSAQSLQHEVSVTLKLVQVYVVDKKGKPVTDLALSDFEVYDNGKLIKVTEFEKHAAPVQGKPAEAQADVADSYPSKLNRKFFLLFDFGFNDQKGVNRAKTAGLHFIDTQVRPKDEVAVLSSSSLRGMTVHEYLTSDHGKTRRAIESLGTGRIAGRASEIELLLDREQQWARVTDPGRPVEDTEEVKEEKGLIKDLGAFAQGTYKLQALQFLQNFRNIAKAFRYVPGNKSVVLFSGGVARSLVFGSMENLANLPEDPYKSVEGIAEYSKILENLHGDPGIQKEFRDLTLDLKTSNTSIYAINETVPQAASADPASRDLRGDEFLRQLANTTGGKYFHNTQDSNKAMEDIQDITGSYYVLGYTVDEKWDGKFHDVKISIKRKGCQTWGVGGYYNPKPFAEFTELEKRLHLIDLALSENPQIQAPAELSLKIFPVFRGSAPWMAVLVQLSEDQRRAVYGPKTEAVVFLFDEQKNLKGLKRTELNLSGEMQGPSCLTGILPVQTGRFFCRIVLRNLDTGRSARTSAEVTVPAMMTAGLKFSSPLWLTAEKNGRWDELSARDSLFAVYPFKRSDYVPVMDDVSSGTAKLYGVFPLSFSGMNFPEILLSAQLIDQTTGRRRTLPLTVLEQTQDGNMITYFVELTLGELVRGSHSLYFFIKEKLGDSKVFISNLTVR